MSSTPGANSTLSFEEVEKGERRRQARHQQRYKFGRLNEYSTALLEWYGWEHRIWRAFALVAAGMLFFFTTTVPLALEWQAVFGILVFSTTLYLRRYTGTLFTLIMIVFSINAS